MNRFQNLQNKFQSTVKDLNANLTDGATRIKQQIQQNVQQSPLKPGYGEPSTEPSSTKDGQQFLKLPIESAKKLRWFDRQDLGMLIDLHLREKQELYDANKALREVLMRKGLTAKQLDAEIKDILDTVDSIRSHDSAVNEVLVLAARAEVDESHEKISELTAQLESLQQRLTNAQQQNAAAAPAVASDTPKAAADTASQEGDTVSYAGAITGSSSLVQALQLVAHASAGQLQGSSANNDGIDATLLHTALQTLSEAAGVTSATTNAAHTNGERVDVGETEEERDDGETGPSGEALPRTASASNVAQQQQQQQALVQRCSALEEECAHLQSELSTARQDVKLAEEAAERKLADARSRFNSGQQAQQDLLRVAQDRRLEAESRYEAAESRATAAEKSLSVLKNRVTQLEFDLKRFEKEAATAAAKLSQAETTAQRERAKGEQQRDANVHQLLQQYKAKIGELEGALGAARQQLASAQGKVGALENKLTHAELATAKAMAEVRELETAVADRDDLALRLSATQARLDEVRAEQSNAQTLRSLATQSEERRAEAEDELVTTAKLAASLESRLAAAISEIEGYRVQADEAESRAQAAEASVAILVAQQWQAAGNDRHKWPPAAQSELEKVEARLRALHASLSAAEHDLKSASEERDTAKSAKEVAESAAAASKAQADRIERDAEQREQRLQATAAAATMQVDEFRSALAKVERERDKLLAEKKDRDRAAEAAAAAVAAAKRRGGGGSLNDAEPLPISHLAFNAPRTSTSSDTEHPSIMRSPLKPRESLGATDILYLKNVMLKFIDAHLNGRHQECEVLLPAVAALLQASPGEFHVLKESLNKASGLGWLYSSFAPGTNPVSTS